MDDLISRSSLMETMFQNEPVERFHPQENKMWQECFGFIENAPAVDAVALEILEGKTLKAVMQKQDGTVVEFLPVVRCKDCRRCDGFPRKEIEPNEIGICRINRMAVKPDDYCSFGERRSYDGK